MTGGDTIGCRLGLASECVGKTGVQELREFRSGGVKEYWSGGVLEWEEGETPPGGGPLKFVWGGEWDVWPRPMPVAL
jgi:hypothetical protein